MKIFFDLWKLLQDRRMGTPDWTTDVRPCILNQRIVTSKVWNIKKNYLKKNLENDVIIILDKELSSMEYFIPPKVKESAVNS